MTLRTALPTENLMSVLSFLDNLHQDAWDIIIFSKNANYYWDSAQNMLKFGLRCSSPFQKDYKK